MLNEPDPTPPDLPERSRHDGWTRERQEAFIEALSETASVRAACERVGMSRQSAYRLRRDDPTGYFDNAWRAALAFSIDKLTDDAFERATEGVARPIFHNGEQVGERRHYSDRLMMFLLRRHDAARYDPERLTHHRRHVAHLHVMSNDRNLTGFGVVDSILNEPTWPPARRNLLATALDTLIHGEGEAAAREDDE